MPRFDPASTRVSLFRALIDAAALHGADKPILEDPERAPLTYKRLVLGAFVVGAKITQDTRHG
ncbi:MAG: hypothetical protein ACOYOJ_16235, partial [Alsobacter sp.]